MTARTFAFLLLGLIFLAPRSDAAIVSFTGIVDQGTAGPVLNSLPRNLILVLNYTPSTVSSANATGTLFFAETPNGTVANPDVNPSVSVATAGALQMGNDTGSGGTDFLNWNGNVQAGLLGPNQVNYTFTFSQPSGTVDEVGVNPDTVKSLVVGTTSVAFIGGSGGLNAVGTIKGTPEPSTMIALTGLVGGGVGFGIRRRVRRKTGKTAAAA